MVQLDSKNILLISPEPWGAYFVSKHHYALALAERGNSVFFLNPPSKRFRCLPVVQNLWVVDYHPLLRGLSHLPEWLSSWLTKMQFNNLEDKLSRKIDIIWNFENSRFFNLSTIRTSVLKISQIVDLDQDFNFKLGCKTADIALAVSDSILRKQKQVQPKSFKIGHGYRPSPAILDIQLDGSHHIKVGYVGNLTLKYLNWPLIYKVVEQNPTLGFYFLGPMGESNISDGYSNQLLQLSKVKSLKNAFFIGGRPYSEVPSYLARFDILLLAYDYENFPNQLENSHKMMEYLASGKVIVSTYLPEFKNHRDLIAMADKSQEFPGLFQKVVSDFQQLSSHNQTEKRKSFANRFTYKKQLARIEKLLVEKI